MIQFDNINYVYKYFNAPTAAYYLDPITQYKFRLQSTETTDIKKK